MAEYSKISFWEVWNFMSIAHGKAEFDDRNIINFKGYNDSGKSAMLTALKVAITNSNPTKQVSFIQDDKEYFRVLIQFDDGVTILRDKYLNGQSLYEMYKDGQLLFSTKSPSGALTKVLDVPKPIADYLGLINYEKEYFNARACFEKQLGVQTSGSENYKMFNTVLKSEELSVASTILNNDKNKMLADIDALTDEVRATKNAIGIGQYITKDMLDYLGTKDKHLDDVLDVEEKALNTCIETKNALDNIPNIPKLNAIDTGDLELLNTVKSIKEELDSIHIAPETKTIDVAQLQELQTIQSYVDELAKVSVPPAVNTVDDTIIRDLINIYNTVRELQECNLIIKEDEERLKGLDEQIDELKELSSQLGVKMVKCPDCGRIFDPEQAHLH